MAIAPDGSWLATVSDDRTARVWNSDTATLRHTLSGHTDRVNAVAISPDGRWLATVSDDRTARVWDAQNGRPVATIRVGFTLHDLMWRPGHIALVGVRGPYLFALHH